MPERTVVDSDIVIEAFTDLAPRYEEAMDRELQELWGLSYKDFIHRLIGAMSIEGSEMILDVATGTAQIPIVLATQTVPGRTMIGLDITPAMLECGKANLEATGLNPRIKLVCASALDMPFTESVFDVVICGLGMHHMDVSSVLREMRRVLKDGGRLIIACVGAPSLWRSFLASAAIRLATLLYSRTHRSARARAEADAVPNLRTLAEWRTLLSDLGFGAIETAAKFPARRLWYPGALVLKATKGTF